MSNLAPALHAPFTLQTAPLADSRLTDDGGMPASWPRHPQVHTGMAEQAFKQQVQSVLGDGNLTPDRAAALEKMREQVGAARAASPWLGLYRSPFAG